MRVIQLTEEDARQILLALSDARGVTAWMDAIRANQTIELESLAIDVAPKPGPERMLLLKAAREARRRLKEPSEELLYALTTLANDRLAHPERYEEKDSVPPPAQPWGSTPIEDLYLTARAYNCLKRAGVNTVGELLARSRAWVNSIPNMGQLTMRDIDERLAELGLRLGEGYGS